MQLIKAIAQYQDKEPGTLYLAAIPRVGEEIKITSDQNSNLVVTRKVIKVTYHTTYETADPDRVYVSLMLDKPDSKKDNTLIQSDIVQSNLKEFLS